MTDPQKHIYQCAGCGVVFGPQSATDALVAAQATRDALAALLKEAEEMITHIVTMEPPVTLRMADLRPITNLLSRIAAVQKGGMR